MAGLARVFLGGGIGSGKSTAAALFAAFGAEVFSADRAAHTVLEPGGSAAAAVAARWPEAMRDGRLDRGALAEIVFADPGARRELEALTHPAIGRFLEEQVGAVGSGVVLVEMPLPIDLLGSGWRWAVVDAPDEVRLARLLGRGLAREEACRRMAAQPSRGEWLAKADLVVDNGAGLDHLEAECRRAWPVIWGWGEAGAGSVTR